MKIIKRTNFLKLPPGTVFSPYEPCAFFGPLRIKGETIKYNGNDTDFYYQQIVDAVAANDCGEMTDILDSAKRTGSSFKLDFDCEDRESMGYPPDMLYAVWERSDVEQLIERLRRALAESE